jgi:hypothetical protein
VYWTVYESAIRKMREEHGDRTIYENLQRLDRLVVDLDRERGIEPPTRGVLRRIVADEAVIGEESSTTQ